MVAPAVRAVARCGQGLENVDVLKIATKTIGGLYDGATTKELDNLSIQTSALLIAEEPEYSRLAARLLATFIHKEVENQDIHSFSQSISAGVRHGLISDKVGQFVATNARKLNDAIESGVIPINTVCPCGLYHGTPSVELDKEVGRLVSEPFGRRGGLGDFGRKVRKSTADERKWYLVTQGEDSVHEIAEWRVLECLEFVDDECHSNPVLSGGLTEFPEDLSELAISVYGAAGSTNRRALAHNLQAPTPLG